MAAKAGILAQGGGTAFQLATQVDAVVFDKTGTLTQNRPSVVGVQRFREDGWLLEAVRVIEQTSSHPLAAALVRYSQEETATNEKNDSDTVVVTSMEEVAGKGALGRIKVADRTYSFRLGNQALMGESTCPVQNQDAVDIWKRQGYSVVYFSLSDIESTKSPSKATCPVFSMAAVFAIADPVRPEAKQVIAALERSGKWVFMLSGDNETTARTIGRELGIDGGRIVAGMLPHEKAQFIRDLKEKKVTQSGRWPLLRRTRSKRSVVMFAGDGLNDSAAVAGADVGIAFAHGSQITLTSASFVLLQTNAPLQGVLDLLNLSTRVYRRQKFNFGWAMVYNIILIPLAAGAFYSLNRTRIPPVWSALAMALSSLSVVVSSLALRWGI